MSYWYYNKIVCDKQTIQTLIDKYCDYNEDGELYFDTEKVIPNPTKWIGRATAFRVGDEGIYFDTNGFYEDIFFEISEQNPDIEFEIDTVDQEEGCSFLILKNGELLNEHYLDEESFEDIDTRFDMLIDLIGTWDYENERKEMLRRKQEFMKAKEDFEME